MQNGNDFIHTTFTGNVSNDFSYEEVLKRYQEAIRALDLDADEEQRFLAYNQLESFRKELQKRLERTKLWNYSPDQRDAVKEARAYLQDLLNTSV
jgi:hypothetical protein